MRPLCFLLLATLSAADQTPLERARDLRDEAREAYLANAFETARTCLSEAVVDDYFNADVWFLLGHTLDRLGEKEAAFLSWEFGRRLWPEKVQEYFPADEFGRLKPVRDRSPARLDALRASIARGDATSETLREAAAICVAFSHWEEARGYLARVEERGEASVEDWIAHVEASRRLGDEDGARRILSRGLAATSNAPALVAQQAHTLLTDGKTAEAGKLLDDAIAAHPGDPSLWQVLGHGRFAGGSWTGARDAYAKAVEANPDLPATWARIALIEEQKLANPERAFAAAYQAYRRAPNFKDEEFLEARMHRLLDAISSYRVPRIRGVEDARRCLGEKSPFRRMEALAWFSTRPAEEGVPVFRDALADPVPEVRMTAMQALVEQGGPQALAAFVAGLDDPRPTVASSSLYGYVLLQGSDSMARLREAASNEFSLMRYAAYLGLWQVDTEESEKLLASYLERESDEGLIRMMRLVVGK